MEKFEKLTLYAARRRHIKSVIVKYKTPAGKEIYEELPLHQVTENMQIYTEKL
jgi:hypothetical protein